MDIIRRTARIGMVLLAASHLARAADAPDTRMAKITDAADAESQVSALTVTNVDVRFGFVPADDHGRIVVSTQTAEYSIPLSAVSSILRAGEESWDVKYRTETGETNVTGGLAPDAMLAGNSDFGSFNLRLGRLNRLIFPQPGTAPSPARRVDVVDHDGHPRPESFSAVLTLTDGTRIEASQLRRNQVSAQSVTDPALLNVQTAYALVSQNFTDFRLLRGETLQTIPFENMKTAEFMPDGEVVVRARSGIEASMKIPHEAQEALDGFNGSSSKGDFYVQFKFVRSVTFPAADK